jgi:ATP-dependent helicase/nuclease subunit A
MNKPLAPEIEIANAAQRRATHPDYSIWVGASAGSGKTKVLTDRVLRLLLGGTAPERILCLTFTKAAAAEMANRIAEELEKWTAAADGDLRKSLRALLGRGASDETARLARRLFARVLDAPGGLKIFTIHAFCQSVLKRFPLEAGLAPHFQVLDDRSGAELFQEARAQVLSGARDSATSPLARALAAITRHVREEEFMELIQELARQRARLKDLFDSAGGLAVVIDRLCRKLGVGRHETEEAAIAAACRDPAFDLIGLKLAALSLAGGGKTDAQRGAKIAAWLAASESERAAGFDAYKRAYLTKDDTILDRLATNAVAERDPAARQILQTEAERLIRLVERCKSIALARATEALLTLGDAMLAAYESLKSARALLDYEDLVLRTRDLLRQEGVAPWVLYKLDGGLDHILVDEAQDTSPLQWEVIRAIADEFFVGEGRSRETRTVFAVGDEKQSIFSFLGADPREFTAMRGYFDLRVNAARGNWETVPLDISFRSAEPILKVVNAVFDDPAAREGVTADKVWRPHRSARQGQAGLVELWPPVAAEKSPEPEPWAMPDSPRGEESPSRRLALQIARFVADSIGRDRLESQDRLLRAGDFLVLVRRRTGFVDELIRALKRRNVAVAGIDRLKLAEHIAVMDLMALGRFLLLPDDDLTLATVLKSPFIGFDDDALFALAHGRGARSLWNALKAQTAARADFAAAERYLADLLARVDFTRPYELYAGLLGAGGGRRALLSRLGADAADPIDEFLNLALAYERENIPTLQGFLHWLGGGEVEIKRELDKGARDQLRIMTVHGAKGLQAPVVILPDTMQLPKKTQRLLWVADGDRALPLWSPRTGFDDAVAAAARDDHEQAQMAEYRRLLYVALTRAADRLYIAGWAGGKGAGAGNWHELVRTGLERLGAPFDFTAQADGASGWSGTGYRLAGSQEAPPETEAADEQPAPPAPAALPAWALAPPQPESPGARPLAPSRPPGEEPPVRTPLGAEDGQRFKRGLLIHRLLELLPAAPAARRREACRRFLARPVHGLAAAAQEEIAAEVFRVLEHPAFAPLFGPGSQAEVPVVGEVAGRDGPFVLSGQIDRLVLQPERILILDYKTNRPPPRVEDEVPALYLRQLAAYRAALTRAYPGRAVDCALLWTDGPFLMPISQASLDRHAP